MEAPRYIEECLKKRILPIVRSHNSLVMFWFDLASIHYVRSTMEWLGANQVDVMPKHMNPPNYPKLRKIEEFWAIVKHRLKKNGGSATDVKHIRDKWNKHANDVSVEVVQRLMGAIKSRVSKFIRSKDE